MNEQSSPTPSAPAPEPAPAPAPPAAPPYPSMPPEGAGQYPAFGSYRGHGWQDVPSRPSRTMAYWSLGLSFLPGLFTIVGAVLALVVLGRTRHGRGDGGRGAAVAALCVTGVWVLVVVVVAVAGMSADHSLRDSAGSVRTTRVVPLESVRVGDCVRMPDRDRATSVTVTPCTVEHDAEMFDSFDLPSGDFPGEDEVLAQAEQGCADRFEGFVGEGYDESSLDLLFAYPNALTWRRDRSVGCIVQDPAGGLVETLRGSGGGVADPAATVTPRPA